MSVQGTDTPNKTLKDHIHAVDEWFQNHWEALPMNDWLVPGLVGVAVSIVWGGMIAHNIELEQDRQQVLETTPSITDVANDTKRRKAFLKAFYQAHDGNYTATATFETEDGHKHKVRISAPTPQ